MIKSLIYKVKKNNFQKLLVRLFLLSIAIIFFDFIIGHLLSRYYFKQKSGVQYRTTYAIEKTREDLIIFGSSTATHDYYPGILEKGLNMSSYNVGRDGNTIFYDYAVLKAILKRYRPKIVILDFDGNEFMKTQESYDRLSPLLPYYKKHPEIGQIIEPKSPYEKYKLLSNIYPYNSSVFSIIVGNIDSFYISYINKRHKNKDVNFNGYFPLSTVLNAPIVDDKDLINYELDSNKIKIYTAFIKECIGFKIQLYIVYSPIFIKNRHMTSSVVFGRKIADENKATFLDYSKDSTILNNPKLFADMMHLNNEGAHEFSNKLTDTIMKSKKFNEIK